MSCIERSMDIKKKEKYCSSCGYFCINLLTKTSKSASIASKI